jgi:hypothetical protein
MRGSETAATTRRLSRGGQGLEAMGSPGRRASRTTLEFRMARKRPAPGPQPEQLVFPFQLRVGDVILDDGAPAEVVGVPTSMKGGKTTRAWLRRDGESVEREAIWEAWRRVRVVRRSAA